MANNSNSSSTSKPAGPDFVIRQISAHCRNFGHVFNDDLYSDLVLTVGEKSFKVHKVILIAQSEYFKTLLTNGMSESNKKEITIEESNETLFEKLLQYVYSGQMQLSGTNDTIDMLVMANKYLLTDLQKSIGDHLSKILSTSNFWSIYSAAFACSTTLGLMAKCFVVAKSKPIEILKADGFSDLNAHALNSIVHLDCFKPMQLEVFDVVSKWIAANGKKDADVLLSNVRLEEMPMGFLLETVRASKLFSESRILEAAAVISKKGLKAAEVGTSVPASMEISVDLHRSGYGYYMNTINLAHLYPFDTITRVKQQVRMVYNSTTPPALGSISYQSVPLEDARTLESYNIRTGAKLVVYIA